MYKVVLIPAGCAQNELNVEAIESSANKMEAQGFSLIHIYQTATSSCVGTKTAVVMVFKQQA